MDKPYSNLAHTYVHTVVRKCYVSNALNINQNTNSSLFTKTLQWKYLSAKMLSANIISATYQQSFFNHQSIYINASLKIAVKLLPKASKFITHNNISPLASQVYTLLQI